MEINKIKEKIKDLEKKNEDLNKEQKDILWLQKYKGEDRVITSEEALSEIDLTKEQYKLFTKIPKLDDIVDGFREGQLVVVSAPTGQGKTSFLQTLTENFDERCLWFTYEVGFEEFIQKFKNPPLFYLPKQLKQNSMLWIEQRIGEAKAKYGCKVVFIDHLHYLLEMQKMSEARSLSILVGMMMRELKKIAIRRNVIVFLVSHMKKTAYDKLPEIEDLRDSSFIGQESDMVIFLKRIREREEYTNKTALKVAKNRRTGKLGTIKLIYNENKFTEYSDEYDEVSCQQSVIF